ncbi:hypothetical protein [Ruminococcus sp.]|uniref:hypothetical protein n=1 Tax=Ruminococcus sp. TaxID=41978 RepID=UPI0025F66098|nr:hypothetical protein [Ruminococcus sp.]
MAKRIISDDTITNEVITRLKEEKFRDKWAAFAISKEHSEISNATEYIIKCEPELRDWIESFIPYMEHKTNNNLIDDIIKDYFGEEFYREDVVPF